MSDHSHKECALHLSHAVPLVCIRESVGGGMRENARLPKGPEHRNVPRGTFFAWNDGRCTTRTADLVMYVHGVQAQTTEGLYAEHGSGIRDG